MSRNRAARHDASVLDWRGTGCVAATLQNCGESRTISPLHFNISVSCLILTLAVASKDSCHFLPLRCN